MSIQAVAWALDYQDLPLDKRTKRMSSAAKLVLIALANHASPDGTDAFPSVGTISRYTGLSERMAQYTLGALVDHGTIAPTPHPLKRDGVISRGDHRPNSYDLIAMARGAKSSTGCKVTPPRGAKSGTDFAPEPSVEPKEEPTPLVSADARTATDPQPGHDQGDGFALEEPPAVKAGVKKTRRSQAATTMPDDFEVTLQMRQWFKDQGLGALGVDGKLETAQFLDHHRAKGSKFKRWDLAWQTWMRNAGKFARQRGRVRLEDLPDDDWRRFVQE